MKMRLTINDRGELVNREGSVVGRISAITVDLDSEIVGTIGVSSEASTTKESREDSPPTPELQSPEGKLFEAPSPEQQVWQHFLSVTGSRQRFDSTRRGVIRNALKLRSPDQLCKAIDGLVLDPWWAENRPKLELRYALRGNHAKGESDEERIDKMITTAERLSVVTLLTTMDTVLATVPSERHGMVREMVVRVNRMYSHPDDRGMQQLGEDALTRLRQFGLEPEVIERDGKRGVGGWRRVVARV